MVYMSLKIVDLGGGGSTVYYAESTALKGVFIVGDSLIKAPTCW